jgi:hypothetical protein
MGFDTSDIPGSRAISGQARFTIHMDRVLVYRTRRYRRLGSLIFSKLMVEIYQQEALTLAATSATGDNEGCCTNQQEHTANLGINLPEDVGICRIAVRKSLNHLDDQNCKRVSKPLSSIDSRIGIPRATSISSSNTHLRIWIGMGV